MDKRFIKINNHIFAVAHIVCVQITGDVARLWMASDDDPWRFDGEEAKALAEWASTALHCQDLMQRPGLHPDFRSLP